MAILSDEKVASLTRRLVDTVIDYKKEAERLAIENEKLCADYKTARDAHDRRAAEVVTLRAALYQAKTYVERDEVAHGRKFGTGNAIRAALGERT